MATSGSTNFATDRNKLIEGALRLCGVIAQGETPTATQYTEGADALNMLVKAWEADGMPLWAMKEYAVPLTSGTASYTIGLSQTVNIPKPLKVVQAFLRNSSTNIDIPMVQLTRSEYNMLGNKTTQGQPIQYWYDVQSNYGTLTVFPTPDSAAASNCTVHIVYQRPFEDFDASSDEPDFPQEWYEAIKYGLATRLAGEYGIEMNTRKMLFQEAAAIKQIALGFGTEEGGFKFSVDIRNW